jgi:hypothetical protein
VDVVKESDEIYKHYSGQLVFEHSKNKEAGKKAAEEYSELIK